MFIKIHKATVVRRFLAITSMLVLAWFVLAPAAVMGFDCGTYNAGAYNEGQVCGASAQEAPTQDNSGLINTGQALSLVIPSILLLTGVILLYRANRKRKVRYEKK